MQDKPIPKIEIPKYQHIAIEFASRIASGEYQIGDKIYARSSIASQYSVSPETARRAICVLSDLDIVVSEKGSGVTIKSRDNAVAFIKQYNKRQTIETIKEKLLHSIERQQTEMQTMSDYLLELIQASEHFRSMNPFMPFEIKITDNCIHLNKTILEMQFWQHTGATVLAVRKGDLLLKSPGPYVALQKNDILYFFSQDDTSQRVQEFLYPPVQ